MKRFAPRLFVAPLTLAFLVAGLWAFPSFWYHKQGEGKVQWLAERSEVPGWRFRQIPVEESAEKILVADRTFNGEFTNDRDPGIYVFSAKRYEEKANEIGLFIHTPDRCWVDAGWTLDPMAEPEYREIDLNGARVPVERRIFEFKGRRELTYFFGLQGGRPLPYRLDHYLSTGRRSASTQLGRRDLVRLSDVHFWARLWDSFQSRRELAGPKQFVRLSTMVGAEEVGAADQRLERFLSQWLTPTDYEKEKAAWKFASRGKS